MIKLIMLLSKKLLRKFRPQPDMLDMCKCGHPFEEHDWGAYSNLLTGYSSSCLVEECQCEDFHKEVRV